MSKPDVGTATQVAEWYEGISGYRFHPTVIGQLYARRGFTPSMCDGQKIYGGFLIINELEALRERRQSFEVQQ